MNDYNPDRCTEYQGFGGNATQAYAGMGLAGHPGIDTGCGYGTDIHSPVSGIVCGLYTPERPASDGFVAVYILVTTALETFEYCIGHMSAVNVKVGDVVKKGDLLGKEGNKGLVYVGQTLITLAMQAAGDHRGSHRHNQKRVVYETPYSSNTGERLLTNYDGNVRSERGWFYEWALPNNGFASCVDPTLPLFTFDMNYGSSGYYVGLLQKALGVKETKTYDTATINAVKAFQTAHGISPVSGFCGPKTRDVLNSLYGQLEDPQATTQAPQSVAEEVAAALPQVKQAIADTQKLPAAQQALVWPNIVAILKSFFKSLGGG